MASSRDLKASPRSDEFILNKLKLEMATFRNTHEKPRSNWRFQIDTRNEKYDTLSKNFQLRKFNERTNLVQINKPLSQEPLKMVFWVFIKLQQQYFVKLSPKISRLTKINSTKSWILRWKKRNAKLWLCNISRYSLKSALNKSASIKKYVAITTELSWVSH